MGEKLYKPNLVETRSVYNFRAMSSHSFDVMTTPSANITDKDKNVNSHPWNCYLKMPGITHSYQQYLGLGRLKWSLDVGKGCAFGLPILLDWSEHGYLSKLVQVEWQAKFNASEFIKVTPMMFFIDDDDDLTHNNWVRIMPMMFFRDSQGNVPFVSGIETVILNDMSVANAGFVGQYSNYLKRRIGFGFSLFNYHEDDAHLVDHAMININYGVYKDTAIHFENAIALT